MQELEDEVDGRKKDCPCLAQVVGRMRVAAAVRTFTSAAAWDMLA